MITSNSDASIRVGQHVALRIDASPLHGLGVFAAEPVAEDTVIEVAPILLVPDAEERSLAQTVLRNYYFRWDGGVAIALGYGSLYNHSCTPNASYLPWPLKGFPDSVFMLVARRAIAVGEEITHNYLGAPAQQGELWFEEVRP